MAYISEVNLKGTDGVAGGEFVEIILGPGDDPADFVVSVYNHNGSLKAGVGISGGEMTLSSLTGVPVNRRVRRVKGYCRGWKKIAMNFNLRSAIATWSTTIHVAPTHH